MSTTAPGPSSWKQVLAGAPTALRQLPRTLRLVWEADRGRVVVVLALTLVLALLPAAVAWIGKLIVDGVVRGASAGFEAERARVLWLVGAEAALLALQLVALRCLGLQRDLLRGVLGNEVNGRILEKALALELRHFEDAATYDKLQNARREAAARSLSLFFQLVGIAQAMVTLAALSGLLVRLSAWSVLVVVAASVPAFLAEAHLSAESFRVLTWRAPEARRLGYLEWVLTRDSHVKEVKLYGLGGLLLDRHRRLFRTFFDEDRALARRRLRAGIAYGLVSLAAFYGMYMLLAARAARGGVTVGELTLYIGVFRQGQVAVQSVLQALGGLYEDALFMTGLFDYLAIRTGGEAPRVTPPRSPPRGRPLPIELRGVSFRYPGREEWALRGISLTIAPGEKLGLVGANGAGKSTLVKLLLRLHEPTEGAILYGGVDLRDMDPDDLRRRVGAVFQDHVRYQLTAAENIGLGDAARLADRAGIEEAARRGGAAAVVQGLPQGYDTVLGGWFEHGTELSAGQWQKLAVARAFMREHAEVLVLDEPTSAIDAEAEQQLFLRFRELASDRTALIVSHRFSTTRMADRIAVLEGGRLEELGPHRELLLRGGRYAHLFRLQAAGYTGREGPADDLERAS